MTQPNIIFIVLDSLRADRVFFNKNDKILTPDIEKLLNNSIYFENCIANSPWTLPSHFSMFTGLYPSQITRISGTNNKLSNKIPILTEILKDMGYFTTCFTENAYISKIYGLARGFDIYIEGDKGIINWRNRSNKIIHSLNFLNRIDSFLKRIMMHKFFLKIWQKIKILYIELIQIFIKQVFWKNVFLNSKNETLNDLEKLSQNLKNNFDKFPFYIFFNIMATHTPYMPIKEVLNFLEITDKDLKILKKFLFNPKKYLYNINLESKHLQEKKIKILKKLYDASVFYANFIVKKIIAILKNLDLFENSYIIITSDHGEHLCDQNDHYLWEHITYFSLYESVIRVPLIIYNKNLKKKIIKNQVQLKDLFHTILHLTGVYNSENKYLELNKSILHQIETNSTPKYIFGEYPKTKKLLTEAFFFHKRFKNRNLIQKMINNIFFLRTKEHKYIKFNNMENEEFYNLSIDPYELFNIAVLNDETYRNMKIKMDNTLNTINNPDDLKDIITEKEKDSVKKIISQLKINGI